MHWQHSQDSASRRCQRRAPPHSQTAVLELLRGLSGRAVVIVTHEPDAAAIADRVFNLVDGKLFAAVAGRAP